MPKGVVTGKQIDAARVDALHGLLAAGYSQRACVKMLRLSSHTVNALARKVPPCAEKVAAIKNGLAAKKWDVADRSSDAITDDKLLKMNAYQLSMISAINTDKALLLEGKATIIVNYQEIKGDIIDIDAKILAAEQEIAELTK